MVHGISPVLVAAGFPVEECAKDGNVGAIPRAVTQMRDALQARYARLLAAAKAVAVMHGEGKHLMAMVTLRGFLGEIEEGKP
jgi:hypothetical protein